MDYINSYLWYSVYSIFHTNTNVSWSPQSTDIYLKLAQAVPLILWKTQCYFQDFRKFPISSHTHTSHTPHPDTRCRPFCFTQVTRTGIKNHVAGFAPQLGRQSSFTSQQSKQLKTDSQTSLLIIFSVQVLLGASHCPPFSGGSSLSLMPTSSPYSKSPPPHPSIWILEVWEAAEFLPDPRWLVKVWPSNACSSSETVPWGL